MKGLLFSFVERNPLIVARQKRTAFAGVLFGAFALPEIALVQHLINEYIFLEQSTMTPLDIAHFSSPETYISGMTALSIPDAGRLGGDWHFIAALCHPDSRIQSAGVGGNLENTNRFFGNRMLADKADILRGRGVPLEKVASVYCANHPRAIADLLFHSVKKGLFPAHVTLNGGIFEDAHEFSMLDELMKLMSPNLDTEELEILLRWKHEHFTPAKAGLAVSGSIPLR